MTAIATLRQEVLVKGFAIRENILPPSEVSRLLTAIAQIDEPSSLQRRNSVFAVRNLLDASPAIRELPNSIAIRALIAEKCDVYCVWSFVRQWL